jgi:hypothetical protein
MPRIRNQNRSRLSAARNVNGTSFFLCILHKTLDGLGFGGYHRNNARGGDHISVPDIDKLTHSLLFYSIF